MIEINKSINLFTNIADKKFYKYQRTIFHDNKAIATVDFYLNKEAHDTYQNGMQYAYTDAEITFLGYEANAKEYLEDYYQNMISHSDLVKISDLNKIIEDIKNLELNNEGKVKIDLGFKK